MDDPTIDSGTVLPVYIRSNIEKIWVVGLPEPTRANRNLKFEIPLTQLHFAGSKRNAQKWAQEFAPHALSYAENLQDGLPIRDGPDNNSRRVYRLRLGEVIKVLGMVRGNPPIGATGEPLPGNWYRVLTNDGVVGYCFSFRLRLFEQSAGTLLSSTDFRGEASDDPDLELVLSRTWSPESYLHMINTRRVDITELERKYRFDPGFETGVARIILPDTERQFRFERIIPLESRAWSFEGTNLQMVLRNNTTLAVQFFEGDTRRTLVFTALPSNIDDIILQENARRQAEFLSIYEEGPAFASINFGTLTFLATGDFIWSGFEALVPQVIPSTTNGFGRMVMDIFITSSLEDRYTGAFTMLFTDIRSNNTLHFMYVLDNHGLRLEVVPSYGIEGNTVTRRASAPVILYFFRTSLS